MHLTIAYSKIKKIKIKKKRNLFLINNATHHRETLTEWPIRLPLIRNMIEVLLTASEDSRVR